MREKGLLKPVTEGTSPIEELTRTQELNLHRLSRKEMRERESTSRSAVDAEVEAAKKAAADRLKSQKEAEAAARKAAADRAAAEAAARAAAERERAAQDRAKRERAAQSAREAEAERAEAERERIEAEEAAAVAAEQERLAREKAEQEKEAQGAEARKAEEGRRSVFERFVKDSGRSDEAERNADERTGSEDKADERAPDERRVAEHDVAGVVGGLGVSRMESEDEADDDLDDPSAGSLQDRLLARVREDGFASVGSGSAEKNVDDSDSTAVGSAAHGDEDEFEGLLRGELARAEAESFDSSAREGNASDSGGSPAESDNADDNAVLSKPHEGEAVAPVLEAEYGVSSLQDEKPRSGLMTAIGILIGLVLGLLVGLGVRAMMSNSDGEIAPEVSVAVVQTWNPVLEENSDCI